MQKSNELSPEICNIYFIPVDDVSSITVGSDSVHKVITLKNGKSWEEIYTAPASKEYSEEQKDSAAGPYYESKVTLFFPGKDETSMINFDNYGNKRILVRLKFHSGDYLLLGSLEVPVKPYFSFSLKKGGYVVTFEWQSIQPSYLLD